MDTKVIALASLPVEHPSDTINRCHVHGKKGTLARFELKQGAIIAQHQHPYEQIVYILSGSVRLIVVGKEYLVKSGEVLIIPSNIPHSLEALEDTIDIEFFAPPRQDWPTDVASISAQ